MLKVAVLEDDPAMLALHEGLVRAAGFECDTFTSLAEIRAGLVKTQFDLLLLDRMVEDGDGLELLDQMRDAGAPLPVVVFVSSRDDEIDVVEAFSRGADDYVVKPVSPAALATCLRAHARRLGTSAELTLADTSPFALDPDTRTVALRGEAIPLAALEYQLAHFLFWNQGRILSRRTCADGVWGPGVLDPRDRMLDTMLLELAHKLRFGPDSGWELTSVYQIGYRLRRMDGFRR